MTQFLKGIGGFALAVALLFATTGFAEIIDNTQDGFAITIPFGWRIIPKPEIAVLNQSINSQYNLEKVSAYKAGKISDILYGYQAESDHWFSYPYVLVRINRAGKKSEGELGPSANADLIKKSAGEVLESVGAKDVNVEVGGATYDRSTHILWSMSETADPDLGKIRTLNGAVQTEEGAIWIDCYAPRETFEAYKPTFVQIIESVRPIDSLVYKADVERSDSHSNRGSNEVHPNARSQNVTGTGNFYRNIGAALGIILSVALAARRKGKQ